MRLIDADEAKKFYKENLILPEKSHEIIVRTMIDAVPTAYDLDKVVEQLEEKQDIFLYDDSDYGEGKYNAFNEAIKIVKQCVVSDDVCEWKSVRNGEFIQNPHTKRLFSNEPSMKNVYCNTCGKKIKAGEQE